MMEKKKEIKKSPQKKRKKKILLSTNLCPGDVLMLTATVRDLYLAHSDKYKIGVKTLFPDIWENNPYITAFEEDDKAVHEIKVHYPLINESNKRPVHFLYGYTQFLEEKLGIQIPITEFKGDVHLTDEEKGYTNQVAEHYGYNGPYWIMMAGGKYDFTAKWWDPSYYQAVVDHFKGRIQFVQCGSEKDWHNKLEGVIDLVGKTNIRQYMRLMYHAEGVVCPVTMAMHMAAAIPGKKKRLKPCVVISGGREPMQWEAYPGHQFLHTTGMLPCCANGGCWKSRCQLVGDDDEKDTKGVCERPIQVTKDLRLPQCMTMIKPDQVINAIEQYISYR